MNHMLERKHYKMITMCNHYGSCNVMFRLIPLKTSANEVRLIIKNSPYLYWCCRELRLFHPKQKMAQVGS